MHPLREQYRALSTACIRNALDRLSPAGQCFGLAPVGRSSRLADRAVTVRCAPVGRAGGSVVDFIDGAVPVPQEREAQGLAAALETEARENQIRAAVAASLRLDEAHRAAAYHQPQRRRPVAA